MQAERALTPTATCGSALSLLRSLSPLSLTHSRIFVRVCEWLSLAFSLSHALSHSPLSLSVLYLFVCMLSVVRAVSLALLAEPEPGPHYAYQSISQGLYEMNGIKD